jgi:hypothetical protein
VDVEFEDIVAASQAIKAAHNGNVNQWKCIFSKRYIPQLVLCIALPIFNQVCTQLLTCTCGVLLLRPVSYTLGATTAFVHACSSGFNSMLTLVLLLLPAAESLRLPDYSLMASTASCSTRLRWVQTCCSNRLMQYMVTGDLSGTQQMTWVPQLYKHAE